MRNTFLFLALSRNTGWKITPHWEGFFLFLFLENRWKRYCEKTTVFDVFFVWLVPHAPAQFIQLTRNSWTIPLLNLLITRTCVIELPFLRKKSWKKDVSGLSSNNFILNGTICELSCCVIHLKKYLEIEIGNDCPHWTKISWEINLLSSLDCKQ